ncbi:MAG: hypothetical protein R3236_01215 [Phycisphaeraceae bacterium]|nr:hypothetical protein [Phycisphaeraceae bacterium]
MLDQLMTFLRQYAPSANYLSVSRTNNQKCYPAASTYSMKRKHSCDAEGRGGTYIPGHTADIVLKSNGRVYYISFLFAYEKDTVYRRMVRIADAPADEAPGDLYPRMATLESEEDKIVDDSNYPLEFNIYATIDSATDWIKKKITEDQQEPVGQD